jgi:hypothetical protein
MTAQLIRDEKLDAAVAIEAVQQQTSVRQDDGRHDRKHCRQDAIVPP